MNVGDRVSLTDTRMTHTGTVTACQDNGMLFVKWDSGITERLHEEEVVLLDGAPAAGGYSADDPKSEGYHDRMADIWDARDR